MKSQLNDIEKKVDKILDIQHSYQERISKCEVKVDGARGSIKFIFLIITGLVVEISRRIIGA